MNSQGRASGDREGPFWLLPLLVFAILALASAAVAFMTWRYSGGDRGWWPVSFAMFLAISCAYALLFSALVRGTALAKVHCAALYTLALALVLIIHAFLFYTVHIDWLVVNTQMAQLTVTQRIIRSYLTPWAIYGAFLIGAMVFSPITRSRLTVRRGM